MDALPTGSSRTGDARIPCLWLGSWMAAHPPEPYTMLDLVADLAEPGKLDAPPRTGAGCPSSPPPRSDDMSSTPPADVTVLLRRWSDGDERALDHLIPLVYDQLRGVAHRRLEGERTGHTLQTTALVHEAYSRMAGADLRWEDRAHFFALAARTMRRILVDYARARMADKRGGAIDPISLDALTLEIAGEGGIDADVLALHAALERLEEQDERKARVVEAHVFGGLTYDETAEALGISPATVDRDLRMAKAWLARELGG